MTEVKQTVFGNILYDRNGGIEYMWYECKFCGHESWPRTCGDRPRELRDKLVGVMEAHFERRHRAEYERKHEEEMEAD